MTSLPPSASSKVRSRLLDTLVSCLIPHTIHPPRLYGWSIVPMLTILPPGIKAKVENRSQYELYLQELKGLKEELGVVLQEELYPSEEK